MKKFFLNLMLLNMLFGNMFSLKGQTDHDNSFQTDRQPCVAGQFYPGTAAELREELQTYFAKAQSQPSNDLLAIVAPHAGYVFSGQVAARAFSQIDPEKKYERIFVIGSSHRTYFDGASVYNRGNYITPLGKAKVDRETASRLIDQHGVFEFREAAHLTEHSLEVQIPFLQYHMKSDFQIVPVVIATQSEKTIAKIAEALKPYFNEKNLFVISSDFSHYPPYNQAREVDQATAGAIASNDPGIFMDLLSKNENKSVPGLETSMCGWSSMLTILNITRNMPGIEIEPLFYQNSGDAVFGDKNRVVGYWAISITQSENNHGQFTLSDESKRALLNIAKNTLDGYITSGTIPEIDTERLPEILHQHAGAFVTLHYKGKLRGCIGRFNPDIPLYKVVQDMTVSAATRDYRFDPVKKKELPEIEIEISVLTPMKKIENIEDIELGRHGIYIKQGHNSGTFLPQVAENTGWTLEEFLGHCSRDKAKIGWDGWKTADVFVYEAIIFEEKDFK